MKYGINGTRIEARLAHALTSPPPPPRTPRPAKTLATTLPDQVPLENLVDSRFIEGTYPLFDSSSSEKADGGNYDNEDDDGSLEPPERRDLEQQGHHTRRRKTSSCFGGLFDPSLELGVHLYRMGPLNTYSTAGRSAGEAVASRLLRSSGSTVERARAAAPDGSVTNDADEAKSSGGGRGPNPSPPMVLWKPPSLVERGKVGLDGHGSTAVSLYARPQMEVRRIGDTSSGGEGAGEGINKTAWLRETFDV